MTPTPLPEARRLEGVVYEKETFNNCGPASLSMLLSYWGWEGNQAITGEWLKPNWLDRNVMPYEMLDYVHQETNLRGLIRYGGDLEMLKRFIANEFPVLIERGFEDEVPQDEWMGHYGVITGYDDAERYFVIQDAYVGPDYYRSYDYIERFWPSFNNLYMIVYPPEREGEVFSLLGPHADPAFNLEHAAQKALDMTTKTDGRDLFFAWYSYGTSRYLQNDYYGAANAYDRAFEIKNRLWPENPEERIDENDPYRIVWYQTGPYFAYYHTQRYQDVIDLANHTLDNSVQDAIEETWVWRGRAKAALGDREGAIADFRTALKWHPGWWVAEEELRNLEVEP
jgi:tetratricopeptide (TPR) repeat protein